MSEEINHDRRRFLGTATMTIAAARLGMFGSAKSSRVASGIICLKKPRRSLPKLSSKSTVIDWR
jgi:hypothetical protein